MSNYTMDERNDSKAAGEKRLIEAAGMDFSGVPTAEIARHFDVDVVTVRNWRMKEAYKETHQQLREEWLARMTKLVTTAELRKKVNSAFELGVSRLTEVLSNPRTRNQDIINATKLAAMLDGRLIKMQDDDTKPVEHGEELGREFANAIALSKKDKGTVQ